MAPRASIAHDRPVPRPTVALFDIDGTLITCGGAGRTSMERAFGEVLGRSDTGSFPYGGMTDPAIARQATRAAGHLDEAALLHRVLERYLGHLEGELARSEGYRVLEGVLTLLEALEPHAHVAVGLGTGNLETGARLKLVRGALWHRFSFGGYGSDHEDRARLLARGVERGAAKLGCSVGAVRVVVIGDTPRDVSAARAIGATVVGVTTGSYDEAALAGADLVVSRLDDARVLARIV